ncbi:MAG: hypothetical protein ABSH19_08255 [Opitutales bacterium]|jgi:hypothetical protein
MRAVTIVEEYLCWSILAGGCGVGVMTLVLWLITRSGISNARMVVAVGSLLTRSYERATLVGAFVHTAAGMFFGLIYTLLLMAIGHPGLVPNIFFGGLIGVVHGLLMALVLVAAVAEEHPLKEFQQSGFDVAVAHWVAHVVYGLVVGMVIGLSGLTTLKV